MVFLIFNIHSQIPSQVSNLFIDFAMISLEKLARSKQFLNPHKQLFKLSECFVVFGLAQVLLIPFQIPLAIKILLNFEITYLNKNSSLVFFHNLLLQLLSCLCLFLCLFPAFLVFNFLLLTFNHLLNASIFKLLLLFLHIHQFLLFSLLIFESFSLLIEFSLMLFFRHLYSFFNGVFHIQVSLCKHSFFHLFILLALFFDSLLFLVSLFYRHYLLCFLFCVFDLFPCL